MKNLFVLLFTFFTLSVTAQTEDYTTTARAELNVLSVHDKTLAYSFYDTLSGSNDTLIISFPSAFPVDYTATLGSTWLSTGTTTDSEVFLQGRNASHETWNELGSASFITEGTTTNTTDIDAGSYLYYQLVCVSASGSAHLKNTLVLKKKSNSASLYSVTYSQMSSLIAGNSLVKGMMYKITDRGDRGIFLTAISPNKLSTTGHRLMLCPATYETTGIWLGVWRGALTPGIGNLVIWDAHVYENNTGAVGTAPDGDAVNWTIVPKTSFSNGEYTEFVFGIVYDFSSDWISEQWDDSGNRIVIDEGYNQLAFDGISTNEYVNETDWNYLGYQDESGDNVFANNTCYGYIKNNIQPDGTPCDIYHNRNAGGIYGNACSQIDNNTNEGGIFDNTCQEVSDNSNMGDISGNSNTGGIESNSNDRGIIDNSNNGDIIMNYCIRLRDNSNGGNIGYNNISGNIANNAHDGPIEYNRNNGNIENCTGSGGFSVHHNTNNGDIDGPAGLAAADVTDAIVNK